MAEYRLTVGLEVHAELKTKTKMFCACLNNADEKVPNKNICPVCMAHPGTLPVINREAVHKVLLVGAAVGGTLADFTEFDRKNYFYPDIPKGYQISQYKYPLVSGGNLAGVELTRIHLEEDTARSQHSGDKSLVDYNRAGVPLMELVTEPVIHDAATAGRFAKELQLLLRTLGAGEANMEKGEMRVEANISIAPASDAIEINQKDHKPVLGTKVEVKNLNSFRSVERAIAYEFTRQSKLLDKGEKVAQETRGWDEAKQETFSQRKKESSHDYRYFPDPDLPKLKISEIAEFSVENLKKELPELPWVARERYIAEGINPEYAEMFVSDLRYAGLFEGASRAAPEAKKLLSNYLGSDIVGLESKFGSEGLLNITVEGLSAIVAASMRGEISSRGVKESLAEVYEKGGDLVQVSKKYAQQSDAGALTEIAKKVIDANPSVAADYKAGKEAAMQFLVGQGMKESKGSANPAALREALQKALL
ncbi:MAG TPA: Asp-tRNA(Asn)/Glu-tRNA(Gln) amidotransferase subunit GatB [Candidatus Paceibacterota bacterium]|nr:Asp-tRNA(Asn)/Glu-tRNA(Gln) amidotransferase subunit GatB [Candidatus Paceibacterota bacterium]